MPRRPPMPSAVKVGPHTYQVARRPALQMPRVDGERPNGCIDADGLTVTIAERLRASKARELLLHELLHGIWTTGLQAEEEQVSALAPRLLQLLRENSDLLAYLTGK